MRYLLGSFFVLASVYHGYSQKPAIDTSVLGKWPTIIQPAISHDGNYALYIIRHQPVESQTIVVRATGSDWKKEIVGGHNPRITADSRAAVFAMGKDSMCILIMGTDSVEYIPQVSSFELPTRGGRWLVYRPTAPSDGLRVRDIRTGKEKTFEGVKSYLFSDNGQAFILSMDSARGYKLRWLTPGSDSQTTDWSPERNGQVIKEGAMQYDPDHRQLAFIVEGGEKGNSLWYWKAGSQRAMMLGGDRSEGIDSGLQLGGVRGFSKDGKRIFLDLVEKEAPKASPDVVKVDIWSYKDPRLQSQQLKELDPRRYLAVIPVDGGRVIRLQHENEQLDYEGGVSDDYVLVVDRTGPLEEANWNLSSQATAYLVSLKDGQKKLIRKYNLGSLNNLSPGGKYVLYYDYKQKDYFSYEVATGITRNVTRHIPVVWTPEGDNPNTSYETSIPAAWMEGDSGVIVYDHLDIWKLDPTGLKLPMNLTNGYGRRHNMVLRLISEYEQSVLSPRQRVPLTALNRTNKDNGFYALRLDKAGDPEKLTMGPYWYEIPLEVGGYRRSEGDTPTGYLVSRGKASESANLYFTKDFRRFTPLSYVYPEKRYNWLSAELVSWNLPDGTMSQGILYKPENFDPSKKYPVIFWYYERLSDELNHYRVPEFAANRINIPWYVSNGYLLFLPDIHYKIGEPGPSAYNYVVSAARYLAGKPWVDSKRMGLQGHSFGGYETEYIVTHTGMFSAALAGSATSDYISGYGSYILRDGSGLQGYFELDQGRIGASLWERPDLYIKNSPIFSADKVTTPLLLMNNKEDAIVWFHQGVEFIMALRRLGKKAWMLQYDGENHSLSEKAAVDYSIRGKQFFDHYLKGAPPPHWMTVGVPARLKGVDSGLELDTSGGEP